MDRMSMLFTSLIESCKIQWNKAHYCHFIVWRVHTEWSCCQQFEMFHHDRFSTQQFNCFLFQTASYRCTSTKVWIYYTWDRLRNYQTSERSQRWQCMWVWGLLRHAWLQMASVVFLSNIHIHCSPPLSSLMPPTTGYFSEDEWKESTSNSLQLLL